MPLDDLPTRLPFLFFLLLFLLLFFLIGTFPTWQRSIRKIRRQFEQILTKAGATSQTTTQGSAVLSTAQRQGPSQLNDFEVFILQQLALAGKKGLSFRRIKNRLHLDPIMTKASLQTLQQKDLVRPPRGILTGSGYRLSAQGHDYATRAGFAPAGQNAGDHPHLSFH